jgi:leucyl aminopeptidase (aminopeptidase T)
MDVSRHMKEEEIASLLETILSPKEGERLLFITDYPAGKRDARREGRAKLLLRWYEAAKRLSAKKGLRLLPLVKYPETMRANADLPGTASTEGGGHVDDLAAYIASADIVVAMNEFSATAPLKNMARKAAHLRVVSMPGVGVEMEAAMSADYRKIAERGRRLAAVLSGASAIELLFDGAGVPKGTRLSIDVRAGGWIVDGGECKEPGAFINFPSGEVFAPPYEAATLEGQSVFGESKTAGVLPVFSQEDGKVAFLKVEKNRIVRVQGDSSEAERIISDIAKDENNANIAEIGFGINELARCGKVVSVLEAEKSGVHVAYGRNDHFGTANAHAGTVKSTLHKDIVYARGCEINATAYAVYPNGRKMLIAERGKVVAV